MQIVLPTKTPSKPTNSLSSSMQGIDISRVYLDISDTFPVFRLWPERGETWELSGQWLAMEAAQAVSAAPGCPSGHQHRPMVSSTGAGVSVSVGPSQSAELPTIEQQQIQFTVELRRAMSSTQHMVSPHVTCGCDPTLCWCDRLANDLSFNERWICLDNAAIQMYACSERVCESSVTAECLLYPKIPNLCKPKDFIAPPPQCRRASNLILLWGHVSQQPVLTLCMF